MRKTLLYAAVTVITSFAISTAFAKGNHDLPIEIVEVVEVIAKKLDQPATVEMSSEAPLTSPVHDAGALLRSVNGMDAARRGGRGFEPVIRGQSQNQINVISNGAYNFGGCPSRMDPPSTYVGFDNFDKVTVIKGNRSVIYGSGGSGGTIIFEHQRPDSFEQSLSGELVAGHTSNSDVDSVSVDVAMGNNKAFIRLFGENKSSDHYEDAKGKLISSAFNSTNQGIIGGWDVTDKDYLEVSFEQADEDDLYYAGNGMDAPFAESETARMSWDHTGELVFFDAIEVNIYRSDVKHLMDNYTLRDRSMMPNGSGMAAPSASETVGGRLLGTIGSGDSEIKIGMDYLTNDRKATLYQDQEKNGSYDMLMSLMWPDVEQRILGLFAQWDYELSMEDMLRFGLRYDQLEFEATTADQPAGMMGNATPSTLYQNYYGSENKKSDHNEIGSVFGWDRQIDETQILSVNVSRSVRAPDATESFIARNAMGSAWVGNPDINPEIHQQLDITFIAEQDSFDWTATVFWNEVDDYIERYKDGTANLYRNVNASLRGAELEFRTPTVDGFSGVAAASYTRGTGDDGDLAHIAPLTGKFTLDYQSEDWAAGVELIAADHQQHIDEDVDVNEETGGFEVINLYSHWRGLKQLTFEVGVENVFNKLYAYHVNTASVDPFNPTAIRVNEPGRQYWLRVRYAL